jgi:hypothetical protein
MRIALAVALVALVSTEASAHCYSRWYYPWPQRCGRASNQERHANKARNVVALPVTLAVTSVTVRHFVTPEIRSDPAIALPSLARADLAEPEADEPTRARLLLRAALEASHGQ